MIGTYRFIQGGQVIAECENLITTAGKKALLEFVAGYTKRLVGSLVVGIGSTAANVADRKLVFEIQRAIITNSTVDYANNAVVFKAQLSAADEGAIYEIGAHTMGEESGAFESQLLLDFNEANDAWSAGTWVSTNSRLGSALQLTAPVSTTTNSSLSGLALDLSSYSDNDTFSIAVRNNNAFATTALVRFRTDLAGNHYTWQFNVPASGTYGFTSVTKGALTPSGTPNWASITQIDVGVTSGAGGIGSIDFDALRIDDTDGNKEESVLVSRAVLGSPVVKVVGLPLDIEYAITL